VRTWQKVGTFGQTVNAVCAVCNSGWMSRLESLARPTLSAIIRRTGRRHLTGDDRVVLSAWLWKVAILHDNIGAGAYFTADERAALTSATDPPTDGVHIWLAAYSGDRIGNMRGGAATFTAPDGRSTSGYLMSLTIGRLAAQVLCVREMPGTNIETVSRYY